MASKSDFKEKYGLNALVSMLAFEKSETSMIKFTLKEKSRESKPIVIPVKIDIRFESSDGCWQFMKIKRELHSYDCGNVTVRSLIGLFFTIEPFPKYLTFAAKYLLQKIIEKNPKLSGMIVYYDFENDYQATINFGHIKLFLACMLEVIEDLNVMAVEAGTMLPKGFSASISAFIGSIIPENLAGSCLSARKDFLETQIHLLKSVKREEFMALLKIINDVNKSSLVSSSDLRSITSLPIFAILKTMTRDISNSMLSMEAHVR